MASIAVNVDQSAAANANIKALEGLLDEFFRDVSNARKAEIERMLTEFGEQVIFSQLSFYVKGEFSGKAKCYPAGSILNLCQALINFNLIT